MNDKKFVSKAEIGSENYILELKNRFCSQLLEQERINKVMAVYLDAFEHPEKDMEYLLESKMQDTMYKAGWVYYWDKLLADYPEGFNMGKPEFYQPMVDSADVLTLKALISYTHSMVTQWEQVSLHKYGAFFIYALKRLIEITSSAPHIMRLSIRTDKIGNCDSGEISSEFLRILRTGYVLHRQYKANSSKPQYSLKYRINPVIADLFFKKLELYYCIPSWKYDYYVPILDGFSWRCTFQSFGNPDIKIIGSVNPPLGRELAEDILAMADFDPRPWIFSK